MAVEIGKGKIAELIRELPVDHPDRIFLEEISKEFAAEQKRRELARKLRLTFSRYPDYGPLAKILPPPLIIIGSAKKVLRGEYQGLTREEVHSNFPDWAQLYDNSSTEERVILSKLTAVNSPMARDLGIVTLGDLRDSDEATIARIQASNNAPRLGNRFARVAKAGFARPGSFKLL